MPALHVDETSSLLGQRTSGTSPSRDASQEPDIEVHSKRSTSLVLKIAAAMYSFVTLGLLTSTIGVMLPPILKHYDLSDIGVSLIFLVGPVGYVLAAQSNTLIHISFGQLGVAILGPILHILSCGVIALHPPFSVVLVAFAFVAAGTGLLDGSWCAWAGNMDNANTVSGLLHGSFSVGAAVGPLLATMLAGNKWFYWYYVLVCRDPILLR
jgi:fucose permease